MNNTATKNDIDPSARLLSEVISELGWDTDHISLAKKVRQLQIGLPAEDEFMLLLSWLGKCRLVNKLDQFQAPPSSKGELRIPDLLAMFEYNDHIIPVLIEVKVSRKQNLSWRPDYIEGLRRYADILKLPVLLAWKWSDSGIWTLCDISNFEKARRNYKLSFIKAIENSILGTLAGDYSYLFQPGVGVHFKLKKLEQLESKDSSQENWHLEISEAYFTDGEGNHINSLGPGIWWLFLGSDQITETEEYDDCFLHRFIIIDHCPMQAIHRLLPLIIMGLKPIEPIPWRKLLKDHSFKFGAQELLKEAQAAKNILGKIYHLDPIKIPAFLSN